MTKVKITVLKTMLLDDVVAEYGKKELGPCAAMKEGSVYYADVKCPEGFCHTAWNCIYQYVFALANGGGKQAFSTMIGQKNRESRSVAVMTDSVP